MISSQPNPEQELREAMLRKIRVDIGKLEPGTADDAVTAILEHIAAANLDGVPRERLVKSLSSQTRISVDVLRKQLATFVKRQRRRSRGDIGGMLIGTDGIPLPLEINVLTLMRGHPDVVGLFALDEFRQTSMMMRAPPWRPSTGKYPRPTRDADIGELLGWVQQQGIHVRGLGPIKTVLPAVIADHAFHPIRDYLDNLAWDGTKRLDAWLTTYLGVAVIADYTGPIGACWMISAVARVYEPGCMVKYAIIIEGPQDLGKSSALAILGGEWFTDDIASLGTKDSAMQVNNAWIIELAELDSTRRADISAIKAFISRSVDNFRPPYGTHVIAQRRQSVLAGTVNPSRKYLHDDTGNVRFWSMLATHINLDILRRDRDQLWAEAVHRYKAGEKWWLNSEKTIAAAGEEQATRSDLIEDHAWFPLIADWLREQEKTCIAPTRRRQTDNTFIFTLGELLEGALGIPKERMGDMRVVTPVGKILRKLGWKTAGVRPADQDGVPVRRWQKIEIATGTA